MVKDVNGVGCRSRWKNLTEGMSMLTVFSKVRVEERGGGMPEVPSADSCMGRAAGGGGCWSAAAAMSRRRAERSHDVHEQRNREIRYLKQCDIFFFSLQYLKDYNS
jgi:hypothetical protein